jgi:NAD(P)-dependent dehydrogenase (short-subunit alcohol dehydrogenase family)
LAQSSSPTESRLFDLAGAVAVVTGAGRGLGRTLAGGLANFGAQVIVADLNLEAARDTAASISVLDRRAMPIAVDVSVPASCEELFARTAEEFGHVDVLVNNAGI